MHFDSILSAVALQSILLATTSIILLFAAEYRYRRLATVWVFSNLLGAISLYSYPANQPDAPTLINSANSAIALLGAFLKYTCISSRMQKILLKNRIKSFFAIVISFCALVYICSTPLRLFMLSSIGATIAAASVISVRNDRTWRGLPAKKLIIATFSAAFAMLAWRLHSAYPFGTQKAFVGPGREQIVALALLIAITVFMQIGFIGLISGRMARLHHLSEIRTARAGYRARGLRDLNHRLTQASRERSLLLELLTHEVRQPLNNAQAAIQTIIHELTSTPQDAGNRRLQILVSRTQQIIDSITLALSNAIVGASLVNRHDSNAEHAIELGDLVNFAVKDCPVAMQSRVEIRQPAYPVFAVVDPGLMRLAMRNLIDNALKYSPADSMVIAELKGSGKRMGALFSVTNEVSDPFHLKGEIFALKVRGEGQIGEGDGIGLYVVSQVARVHHGLVTFDQPSPDQVRFDLFIPM